MAEPAHGALTRAVNQHCLNQGGWGSRIYNRRAPAGVQRPYMIFQWQGGGELNRNVVQDANIVLLVKAVANSLAEALMLSGQLSELLNDAGYFDNANSFLDGGADWWIKTTTQEGIVEIDELVDGEPVYHEGFFLRVQMERK
ncbi:MAG: hypothetical protein E6Q97_30545 [Desulfurellales bacterium]|nr:MAG: hypothetical protein E6Q97_30545 [Desulfurellales bacterium]